jgi:hypothetical protein
MLSLITEHWTSLALDEHKWLWRGTTDSACLRLYSEAVAMLLESKRVIEPVGFFAVQVAGECHFITAGQPALLQRMLHHCSANTMPLMLRMNRNVFNNTRLSTTLRHVIHDEQLIRADDRLIDQGNEHSQ